ncbi:hypothetical protein SAMN05428954_0717 [Streptomyces sp. 2112.3]|nr:hypothetical protein SAMN05428954_0717 [Streptomyces sp. 2112.3]
MAESAVTTDHTRAVLAHVADHTPLPGPEARLLMLTLRTAHTGTANPVGQDLTALGLTDPERLVEQLTGCGWLGLPGTAGELFASRPENPTPGRGDQNSRQRGLPWKHGKRSLLRTGKGPLSERPAGLAPASPTGWWTSFLGPQTRGSGPRAEVPS